MVPAPAGAGRVPSDRLIAELGARQYGVVSRAQLLERGVTSTAISVRLARGSLHPVHRGVYVVGHTAAVPRARELAAILACGPRAVISHRSAAGLWRLLSLNGVGPVDVTVIGTTSRRRPGVKVRRSRSVDRSELRQVGGIPVTSPARTILDLAGIAGSQELERALAEAQTRNLVGESDLRRALARHGGRRNVAALRALLDRRADPALTRSGAEERLLSLIRRAQLPEPRANAKIGAYEVDLLWRDRRLVVEVDGFRFHSDRRAFERDRRRDADLQASGFRVMRVTWRQLVDEPEATLARLAAALALPP